MKILFYAVRHFSPKTILAQKLEKIFFVKIRFRLLLRRKKNSSFNGRAIQRGGGGRAIEEKTFFGNFCNWKKVQTPASKQFDR